jgi:hypothetical protein
MTYVRVVTVSVSRKSCRRFEVLMAVKTLMMVFWTVTLCGLVGRYQHGKLK